MSKLANLITADRIIDLKATTKNDALKELFAVMESAPEVTNGKDFERSVLEREQILTTGIGSEIAVPHVKIPSVSNFVMAIGRSRSGIDFEALDGKPVHLVILIASSDKQRDEFLKVLDRVVQLFKDEVFRRKILKARTSPDILN
ncbi:MAG TPA: PTS sugar transporter subunit IIA, partial [bacterium]|nr:PTS sugar transporter subunit IIA [bacterium]